MEQFLQQWEVLISQKAQATFFYSQYIQTVNRTCTELNYTVFSLSQSMAVELLGGKMENLFPAILLAFT